MRNKPSQRKPDKGSGSIIAPRAKSVNMLTDSMEVLGADAQHFRRFTRAVFSAHAAILKHGDAMNARFKQSAARWRALIRVKLGDESASEIARTTAYSRQSVHRLLAALQSEGLIKMLPDPSDQRRLRPQLTKKGQAVLSGMEYSFNDWSAGLVAHLQTARLDHTSEFLEQAAALLQQEVDTRVSEQSTRPHQSASNNKSASRQ